MKKLIASALLLLATPLAAEPIKVVTTFTVIADMAENVAGEHATVVSITRPGAEIHGYQPTPRDVVGIQDADLILWNGLNLERWFEDFFRNAGDVPAVVLTDGIDPMSISGGDYDGKPNPHAWMSPDNALIYVSAIEAALTEIDPENAAAYAANAEAYRQQIREVLDPLRAELAEVPEAQRWLVSCEGAFSYLARDLGLRELYLWPINADQNITPRQMQGVIDTVRENEIPAVFCESTVSPKPAEQVARETGAQFGGVLYVDSLSEADGPVPTYLDLLRVTTETIVAGLKGN